MPSRWMRVLMCWRPTLDFGKALRPELTSLRDEFVHDAEFARRVNYFAKLAQSDSALQAHENSPYSVLLQSHRQQAR